MNGLLTQLDALIERNSLNFHQHSKKINEDFLEVVALGDVEQVKLVLGKGADINYQYDTALRMALEQGNETLARFLCENGADYLNITPEELSTAGRCSLEKLLVPPHVSNVIVQSQILANPSIKI